MGRASLNLVHNLVAQCRLFGLHFLRRSFPCSLRGGFSGVFLLDRWAHAESEVLVLRNGIQGFVIGCLALGSLVGCRDELSESAPEPIEAPKGELSNQGEVVAVVPEPEIVEPGLMDSWSYSGWVGSVPFDLSRGANGEADQTYLLTGFSAGEPGQTASSFESYLRSSRGQRELERAAARIESTSGKLVLHAQSNVVLSFETIGLGEPLEIHTHGRDLVIIAEKVGDVSVVTTGSDRHSGSVTVLATQSVAGRYDLRGANGRSGADGQCPEGFVSCLSDRSLRFPAPLLTYEIVDADSSVTEAPPESLAHEMQSADHPSLVGPPSDVRCPAGQLFNVESDIKWYGGVRSTRQHRRVQWSGNLVGKGAFLSHGQPGAPGKDGGALRFILPPDLPGSSLVSAAAITTGGEGGSHGRHGWVGASPAPFAAPVLVADLVVHDARTVSRTEQLTYQWRRFERSGLPSGGGYTCRPHFSVHSKFVVQRPIRPLWEERIEQIVQPPATAAGEDVALPGGADAPPGADGRVIWSTLAEANLLDLFGQKIPLSDGVVSALEDQLSSE